MRGADPHLATPAEARALKAGTRDAPVDAVFRMAVRLNGEGSVKDTRHVVLDISGSGLSYEPGDSLGVYPRNDPALADTVLATLGIPPDFPIGEKSIRDTLIEDSSLGVAPDMLFELMSHLTGGERRQKARLLAKGEDPDGDADTLDVLATLEKFGPVRPDPEALIECLEPLQPRLYSIASSPLVTPDEVHLTVDAVRYRLAGRTRLGVASTFFADRAEPGTSLKVYLQKAHEFALPKDRATPIVMVGPGTGVAPFRSFLWYRKAVKATGRAWLFFGHQRETTDFFYRDELEAFLNDGTLTRLSTAWSRDGERKVYVQDLMHEAGPARRPRRMDRLAILPLFFPLAGRRAVVVGGNEAAAWKAELISAAGARVDVLSPAPCAELQAHFARESATNARIRFRTVNTRLHSSRIYWWNDCGGLPRAEQLKPTISYHGRDR